MDAVEFLREWDRMCRAESKVDNSCGEACKSCEMDQKGIGWCAYYVRKEPERAIKNVKDYMAKHPIKTRQSEFLKMFPNARMEGKTLDIDPCQLDMRLRNSCGCKACHECREEYWLEEVED